FVHAWLFLFAATATFAGWRERSLGQPDARRRLDHVRRCMAGVYRSAGLICLWAALPVRQQGTLVYLLALGVLMAGIGRLVSIRKVGLPKPAGVWLGYLIPELLIPFVMAGAHYASA